MRLQTVAMIFGAAAAGSAGGPSRRMTLLVNTTAAVGSVSPRFLSVTMDGGLADTAVWQNEPLAAALAPAYLRLGGNSASTRVFRGFGSLPEPRTVNQTTVSSAELEELARFSGRVGWSIVLGLNAYLRTRSGDWDPNSPQGSAAELVAYVSKRGNLNGTLAAYELGNEPDLAHYAYNVTEPPGVFPISPQQYTKDFRALRRLISQHYSGGGGQAAPFVVGPSVANSGPTGGGLFWSQFFGNSTASTVDAASWHHYYGSAAKATVEAAHSAATLDSFISGLSRMSDRLALTAAAGTPLWVDETSSFYGGGTENISDRFVAGFTWLDKLGVAARMGVQVVCRQAWRGGAYSLLDQPCHAGSFCPTPDYFSSVIYKRLMGVRVLDVPGSLAPGRVVRTWAHCTSASATDAAGHVYPSGSVTLLVLNTLDVAAQLSVTGQLLSDGWDEYVLSPGNLEASLASATVALNGNKVQLTPEGGLPALKPRTVTSAATLDMPAQAYGFFVLRGARAAACQH